MMRRKNEVLTLVVALAIAAAFIDTGAARLPVGATLIRVSPVVVYGEPMVRPLLVTARKSVARTRGLLEHAIAGIPVKVSLTQYCLRGETRRGRFVRPGIVAADPRVFPLARYVDVYLGEHYIGRYLVDDTGGNVKGRTLDIWTPSCREGSRFGRQWGQATLVASDEEDADSPQPVEIDRFRDLKAIGALLEGPARR
jgi:3D (Asp-Asp-Asp) domain-containing protein